VIQTRRPRPPRPTAQDHARRALGAGFLLPCREITVTFNPSLPQIESAIAEHWGLRDARIRPLAGGMTSLVWSVDHPRGRWVAKAVPAGFAGEFASGLTIATRLHQAGIASGAPSPALDGRSTVAVDGWVIGLLHRVEGEELTGETENELRLIGRTLAAVHRALGVIDPDPDEGGWPYLDPQAEHLAVRPWVRPAVEAGISGVRRLGAASLTWGLVHGDPAPEAFVHEERTGACGLIDWGAAHRAPLLFDLASAVMYVGPERAETLIRSYRAADVLPDAEIARGLLPMLDYRWSLQAYYFARRIATHDMIGIDGPAANDEGLEHARVWWAGRASELGLTLPGVEKEG
jgi:Ser/Thr protein kinase RdoA (MazF antagonist)